MPTNSTSSQDWYNYFSSAASKVGVDTSTLQKYVSNLSTSSGASILPTLGIVGGVAGAVIAFFATVVKKATEHLSTEEAQALSVKQAGPFMALYDAMPQEGRDQFATLVEGFSQMSQSYNWIWTAGWKQKYPTENVRGDLGGGGQRARLYWQLRGTLYIYLLVADKEVLQNDATNKTQWYGEFDRRVIQPLNAFLIQKMNQSIADIQTGAITPGATISNVLSGDTGKYVLLGAAVLLVFFIAK